jgi:hypothetical protein
MSPDEAGWAAELMDRRREIYARYSPVFWRPAQGVKGKHADFLGRQIGSASNVALRTDHAFIIAQQCKAQGFADDFAVDQDGSWDGDGATLLLAASDLLADTGVNTVMVVTAHADEAKASMLSSLSPAADRTMVGA